MKGEARIVEYHVLECILKISPECEGQVERPIYIKKGSCFKCKKEKARRDSLKFFRNK